jgi:hypothetical protein
VVIKEHIAALIRKQFPHHYVIVKDDTISGNLENAYFLREKGP